MTAFLAVRDAAIRQMSPAPTTTQAAALIWCQANPAGSQTSLPTDQQQDRRVPWPHSQAFWKKAYYKMTEESPRQVWNFVTIQGWNDLGLVWLGLDSMFSPCCVRQILDISTSLPCPCPNCTPLLCHREASETVICRSLMQPPRPLPAGLGLEPSAPSTKASIWRFSKLGPRNRLHGPSL